MGTVQESPLPLDQGIALYHLRDPSVHHIQPQSRIVNILNTVPAHAGGGGVVFVVR